MNADSYPFASAGPFPPASGLIPIPILSGGIPAGNAQPVDDSIKNWIFLPKDLLENPAGNLVALRIEGKSMEPYLPDGALVVVDRTDREVTPEAIFALREAGGGYTVKRVKMLDENRIALIPANLSVSEPEFWTLGPGETLTDRVIGKVVWVGINLLGGASGPEGEDLPSDG